MRQLLRDGRVGVSLASAVALLVGCSGDLDAGPSGGRGRLPPPTDAGTPAAPVEGCRQPTQEIFAGLHDTCAGCHGAGTTLPAFADLASFEQLIAYDPRLVIAGDPGASRLVALLEGTAVGTYRQMPLAGEPYATLASTGAATLSMERVRAWVTDLTPCGAVPNDDPALARRVSAGAIRASLYEQLGLSDLDFFGATYGGADPNLYPLRAPHDIPRVTSDAVGPQDWRALGGPDFVRGSASDRSPSATVFSTLIPLSQAWCRLSVESPANDALFRHTTRDATSAASEADIRANLRYLQLRLLGLEATDDEVTQLYRGVFRPVEERTSPRNAWIAVCSALIRHPLWLTE
jgi:hypothetical protein